MDLQKDHKKRQFWFEICPDIPSDVRKDPKKRQFWHVARLRNR
uniref:Uncharacterized protein n=1 Tax=Arundo donax TaxID=35708 RepID=A0A0A9C6E3_ARUDO